jgi:ribonucleoside-diphosphate reductase alpha chain
LCSEISLVTSEDRTFVCCLSSVNVEWYNDWKDNELFIPDIVEMLDNVISVFCEKAKSIPEMKRAVYSAMSERSIGIGMLGWHALLMRRGIPFESPMAVGINKQIWSKMNAQAKAKTVDLASSRGACPDSVGSSTPVRNAHLFSIAPNASSSILMNTSPSAEPYRANVYLEKGVNGTQVHKNKYLEDLLNKKGQNTQAVWTEIVSNDGSVSSLDFLDDFEKDVFKTSMEIDQTWVIQHAADRQPYICQAQSLNLFFSPTTDVEYLHLIHLMAWKTGLKSLYYCRSDNMRKADKVGKKVQRERIEDMKDMLKQDEPICIACE